MMEKTRKYKIDEYLLNLNVREYRKAMHTVPKILNISLNTFINYRNIKIGDRQDIPYEKVVMMEQLFGFKSGELTNCVLIMKPLKELVNLAG